jgi:hypothetical protein
MKIVCIAGLPGSGKTWLARRSAAGGGTVCDDIRGPEEISLDADGPIYITHCHFCIAQVRSDAATSLRRRFPDAGVEFWFFENDPAQCLANVKGRNDGREVEGLIRLLSRNYVIPRGAKVIPVWRSGDRPDAAQP